MSEEAESISDPVATDRDVAMTAPSEESRNPAAAVPEDTHVDVDVDNNDDEEDPSEESASKTPTLEAPLEVSGKRQRKAPERIDITPKVKEVEKLVIKPGNGEKLGDLDNVQYWITRIKAVDLNQLHYMCFGARGKKLEIKKHVREFSGWPNDLSEADLEKRQAYLQKMSKFELNRLAECLDIGTSGTNASKMEKILEFLKKPTASGKRHPKEIRAAESESKAKKVAKKSRAAAAKKKKRASAKGKKKSAAVLTPPDKVKSALMFFAIENRKRVKEKHNITDKADLMRTLKDAYVGLSAKDKAKYIKLSDKDRARFEREQAAYEAAQADDEDDEDLDMSDLESDEEEEEEEKPKKSPAKPKKAPVKRKKAAPAPEVSDDSADDSDEDSDTPLTKKAKSGPTKAQLRAAINAFLAGANLEELSRKKVYAAMLEKYPDLDAEKQRGYMKSCIQDYIDSQ
eukprot:m.604980 g.604980  ORF g.604980 m.604980 type:complete len:457 (-) comp22463_c0_seq7:1570-2940(-)